MLLGVPRRRQLRQGERRGQASSGAARAERGTSGTGRPQGRSRRARVPAADVSAARSVMGGRAPGCPGPSVPSRALGPPPPGPRGPSPSRQARPTHASFLRGQQPLLTKRGQATAHPGGHCPSDHTGHVLSGHSCLAGAPASTWQASCSAHGHSTGRAPAAGLSAGQTPPQRDIAGRPQSDVEPPRDTRASREEPASARCVAVAGGGGREHTGHQRRPPR